MIPGWLRRLRFLPAYPIVNPRRKQVERQCSSREHFIVERAQIELVSQLTLCVLPQLQDLQLSDLVAKSLSRLRHVAIGFALY